MAKVRRTFRGQSYVVPGWLFVNLVRLISALTLSACGNLRTGPTAIPAQVVFATPVAEIVDGVRLTAPVHTWDGYGEAVDVRGDVLVIGANDGNHYGPGSAYVYRFLGGAWQPEAQLTASDRNEGQGFGGSVALGEGIIAIGAPGNTYPKAKGYPSAVYVFEYDGQSWVEAAKLTPAPSDQDTDPEAADWLRERMRRNAFGAQVAVDGDTVAAGGDMTADSVYVFQRGEDGWHEQARLPIPGSPGRELYVGSLTLFGDSLAVSALYVTPESEQASFLTANVIIYVFERVGSTWEESFRFTPDGGQLDYLFPYELNVGASVALGGSSGQAKRLAVGLPGFPDLSGVQGAQGVRLWGSRADIPEIPESRREYGSVYIFERGENGGWSQQVTLLPAGWDNPPGPAPASLFSSSPPVGTPLQTPPPPTPGPGSSSPDSLSATSEVQGNGDVAAVMASFVFPGDVYSENPEISFFGATVDLDENLLAVTAGYANATYVFEHQGQDWLYRFRIAPRPEKAGLWEDFAQVVTISGETVLLGTPGEFGDAAYVFDLCVQPSGICR